MEQTQHRKHLSPLYIAFIAALGSGFEYYDFVIYGMMVNYLSEVFFPTSTEFLRVAQAFSIFSIGYLVRPIGGAFFGVISDCYGRKQSFITIMALMAFSTLFIGCLPTYQMAGSFAPLMLVALRLLQGISFGAELPSAATIVVESSHQRVLGRACGLVLSGTSLGALMATFVLAALSSFFTDQEIIAYAWRLPFIFGGVLAWVALYSRKHLYETEEFLQQACKTREFLQQPKCFLRILKEHSTSLLIALGLTFLLATLIIIHVYSPVFLSKYFGYSSPMIYRSMSIGMAFSFLFMILFGHVADHVDKKQLLFYGMVGIFFSASFMNGLLKMGDPTFLTLFFITYQFWIAVFFVSYLPIVSRLFPTKVRCSALALTYNAAFTIASTIPTIGTVFFSDSASPAFLLYFLGIALGIGAFSLYTLQRLYADPYAY
ncbi:MAG: MFS transporter [Chlamydiota bacterium]